MMEIYKVISIPIVCPKCEGEMLVVKYGDPSNIFDEQDLQICRECDYQIPIESFKEKLCTK